jgi:outer membrane protein TolC
MDRLPNLLNKTGLLIHPKSRKRSGFASNALIWKSNGKCGWPVLSPNFPERYLICMLLVVVSAFPGCSQTQYWLRNLRPLVTPDQVAVTSLSLPFEDSAEKSRENGKIDEGQGLEPRILENGSSDSRIPDAAADTDLSNKLVLSIEDVIGSVLTYFPQVQSVLLEGEVAQGNLTAAMGNFDLNLGAQSVSEPLGYYQNYRNSLGFNQNLFQNGANVYGGYRIGRGTYPTWYKQRETNDGGELALGAVVPLRQNRLIDTRRANVFRAQQDLAAVDPLIRDRQNLIVRMAKITYWDWVVAGIELEIQKQLLDLAIARAEVIDFQVQRGQFPRLTKVDNDRLIAQRKTRLVESTRRFEAAQIRLSIFLRDSEGNLLLADSELLPEFPELEGVDLLCLNQDIATAINVHPEIARLDLNLEKARIDLAEANNLVLGRLDGFVEGSQDVGGRSSPIADKTPFELQMGLMAELPLQRRLGLGRVMTAQAKLRQMELDRELIANEIKTAVQDSYSGKENAYDQFTAAQENVRLANEALGIAKDAFEAGNVDLIVLNIYEQSVADAELEAVRAAFNYFVAEANYQLAMGRF